MPERTVTVHGIGQDYEVEISDGVQIDIAQDIIRLLEEQGKLPYRTGLEVGNLIAMSIGRWAVDIGDEEYQVLASEFGIQILRVQN